jgi:hypothetical protein
MGIRHTTESRQIVFRRHEQSCSFQPPKADFDSEVKVQRPDVLTLSIEVSAGDIDFEKEQ